MPDVETLGRIVELFRALGVNPSPPPTPIANAAPASCVVVGTVERHGSIHHTPKPGKAVSVPPDLAAEPIVAYEVATDDLGALGRGWILCATDRRSGVPPQALNALAIVHSLQQGAYLGFLRAMPKKTGQPGYILERLGGTPPVFLDDVAWAERIVLIRPS
jgi:hypothetical protein